MPTSSPINSLIRYAMATAGSVASAGAQFALSLVLVRLLAPAEFGRFSFLLVLSQLSWGVWSALFCAPLPALLATDDNARRDRVLAAVMSANLIAVGGALAVFLAVGRALGQPWAASVLFAGYAAAALLRWFGRAYGYATGAVGRTIASDIAYGVALLGGTGVLLATRGDAVALADAGLLFSAVVGLAPLGRGFLKRQLHSSWSAARRYRGVWTEHARWSLLGVLTTEATANAHVYLVTLLQGAAAFAPISASTLVIRPMNVAMNALSDYERPAMARRMAMHGTAPTASIRLFRAVLVAAWIATAIGATAMFRVAPHLLFPPRYDQRFLVAATALWMAVTMVRLLRLPESVMLQAAGAFRPLAMASVLSAGLSITAVVVLLRAEGPLWSIGGILMGELAFAAAIWRQAQRWSADRVAGDAGVSLQ